MRKRAWLALVCGVAVALGAAAQKKKKEELTQTLQLPKELPGWIAGDPRHLTFHVTPLSAKGLLSQQIRDALKAGSHETGGETVLKIRAFVAGSGDLRRVRDLVSEYYTDRKQPLPVLSLIRSGGLPMEGAQVVLELIGSARKEVNPHGLALISAQAAVSDNPMDPVAPLAGRSMDMLRQAVQSVGTAPADVLRVSCFLSSLENLAATRKLVEGEYPRAAINYVQTQRSPVEAVAACEAVARVPASGSQAGGGQAVEVMNPAGLPKDAEMSQIARVSAPQVILTGTQISFGYQDADAKLAFDRLKNTLEQAGTSPKNVIFAHVYPLALPLAAQVRKIRTGYFDAGRPPAGSMVLFEGLPSMDAGFAVDVIAVK